MSERKGGRPRGPDYEKNLAKRRRRQDRVVESSGNLRLLQITKALYHQVQRDQRRTGKQPVFSREDFRWLQDGILLRDPARTSFEQLRSISYSNSLIGAIHNVRVDDLGRFAHPFDGEEGFDFDLVDEEKEANRKDRTLIREAREFFRFMGDRSEGWSARDNFNAVFQFMLRDTLAIDRNAFYVVRNRKGEVREIRYLDPATIYQVGSTGYRGNRSIGFVQIVDRDVRETFSHDEILLRHKNRLSDVRYRLFGLSPAEISIMEIIGVINSLKFNRQRFSNNPPPGFLSVRGIMGPDQLDSLQTQWEDLWSGNENNFRIPVLSSDEEVQWTSLGIQSDIAFEKLMQWLSTFVLACHGMDQAELGLRLMGNQTLSESSPDGRIQHSMSRANRALLSYFASVHNDLKELDRRFAPIVFVFRGIDPEDEDRVVERQYKLVRSVQTVDEIRALRDLPTLGEEIRDRYDLTDEEFESSGIKYAGAGIVDATWNQMAGPMLQSLTGQGLERNQETGEGAPPGDGTPDEPDSSGNWWDDLDDEQEGTDAQGDAA